MKIKCPKCKENAELAMDYSEVKCGSCDLDMSYGEYVKFVAHNEIIQLPLWYNLSMYIELITMLSSAHSNDPSTIF